MSHYRNTSIPGGIYLSGTPAGGCATFIHPKLSQARLQAPYLAAGLATRFVPTPDIKEPCHESRLNPFNLLRRALTLLAALFLLAAPLAQAVPTTPTSDFTDNNDGTVTHKTTGLTWKRCPEGQTWNGGACTGTATAYTWAQATALTATFAGKSDWRLPNIRELSTITEMDAYNPAINSAIFPNTFASAFWSASAYAGNSDDAWNVNFYNGNDYGYNKTNYSYVRLVRGGQSLGLLALNRPATDYVDNGDGAVTHTPTALTWKRCAEGQAWSGSTCSGTATTTTWAAATALTSAFAGKSDWRLPTWAELRSLVDFTTKPSINTTIFPNTPMSYFWSASSDVGYSDHAWSVNFHYGYDYPSNKTHNYYVRLVRGGQSLGSSSTPADCLFNWAEKTYAEYFSPVGGKAQTQGDYYYRQYTGDAYLAISSKDNHLYYLIGGNMGDAGAVAQWYAQADCQ